jgi:hypothetical protein
MCNVIISLYFSVVYLNILIAFITDMNGRYLNIRKSVLLVAEIIFVWVTAPTKRGKSVIFKMVPVYNWWENYAFNISYNLKLPILHICVGSTF